MVGDIPYPLGGSCCAVGPNYPLPKTLYDGHRSRVSVTGRYEDPHMIPRNITTSMSANDDGYLFWTVQEVVFDACW